MQVSITSLSLLHSKFNLGDVWCTLQSWYPGDWHRRIMILRPANLAPIFLNSKWKEIRVSIDYWISLIDLFWIEFQITFKPFLKEPLSQIKAVTLLSLSLFLLVFWSFFLYCFSGELPKDVLSFFFSHSKCTRSSVQD